MDAVAFVELDLCCGVQLMAHPSGADGRGRWGMPPGQFVFCLGDRKSCSSHLLSSPCVAVIADCVLLEHRDADNYKVLPARRAKSLHGYLYKQCVPIPQLLSVLGIINRAVHGCTAQ